MDKEKIENNVYIPMPVCLVGSICRGKANYMTVGWITRANANPPMLAIGIGRSHLSWQGIRETGEFSVNFPVAADLAKADYAGLVSGTHQDKSSLYTAHYGTLTQAPMIAECPLSLECKVVETCDLPTNSLYIGEIVGAYAQSAYLEKGNFAFAKAGACLLTMRDNTYWSFGSPLGKAWHDGLVLKTKG